MGKVDITLERIPIKSLALQERPREKLLHKGRAGLTDAELLAILIGSGTKQLTALDIGRNLLKSVDYDLRQLGRLTAQELCKFEGLGEAKAVAIVSALELGRRRMCAPQADRPKVTCSEDVYLLMQHRLLDLPHEEFWVVLLNRSNHVIRQEQISAGGVSGTIADPKIIFKKSLDCLASAIILVHNHPSGNKQPSQADIQLTKKLKKGGELLEVPVLDHLIFTDEGFFSFNDEGMF